MKVAVFLFACVLLAGFSLGENGEVCSFARAVSVRPCAGEMPVSRQWFGFDPTNGMAVLGALSLQHRLQKIPQRMHQVINEIITQ